MLDLVLMQQDSKVLTVGKGINKLDHMLEVLACAELETQANWEDLTKDVIQLAPSFSGCIMVFGDWSEERANLVNRTKAMGVTIMCLLVYSDQEEVDKLLSEIGCGVQVHLLKVGQIQKHLDLALQSW